MIKETLKLINDIAKEKGFAQPFICGGIPRDKLIGIHKEIKDVDITSGDDSIHKLALETAKVLYPKGAQYKVSQDGHAQIIHNKTKYDFSSNFIIPGIKPILAKAGLVNPTNMQMELYSRDFTVDALLMTMDLKTIKDPIGLGIKDINKKIIRTCFPARITLGYDPKRIPRSIYLSCKLDFDIDVEITNYIKQNKEELKKLDQTYIVDKITQAVNYNKEKAAKLITDLGIWDYIPASGELTSFVSENLI